MKAADLAASPFMRLCVLGSAKVGKSCTVISTAPKPVLVLNSDDPYSLTPVLKFTAEFDYELMMGDDLAQTERCFHAAQKGVKEGRYATIVWDTMTVYSQRASGVYGAATADANGDWDARRWSDKFSRHLLGVLYRLSTLPAHLIVNAHWTDDQSPVIAGQTAKKGEGILPGLPGKSRAAVAAWFQDIVFLEKEKNGDRVFITNDNTGRVFGPGARNLPGNHVQPADVTLLWRNMCAHNQPKEK